MNMAPMAMPSCSSASRAQKSAILEESLRPGSTLTASSAKASAAAFGCIDEGGC